MFRLIDSICKQHDIQYIAALNEHDLTSMIPLDEVEAREFHAVFSKSSRVLELTDGSPRERLLGIEVDMNYREKSKTRPGEEWTD